MATWFKILVLGVVFGTASCAATQNRTTWVVQEMEIALYHSSTIDPETGNIAHVEYCAAKLSSGPDVVYIVYRPIDYPDRNPGFAPGDAVTIRGLDKAEDFGAVDGRDYWISDVEIVPSAKKPDGEKDRAP